MDWDIEISNLANFGKLYTMISQLLWPFMKCSVQVAYYRATILLSQINLALISSKGVRYFNYLNIYLYIAGNLYSQQLCVLFVTIVYSFVRVCMCVMCVCVWGGGGGAVRIILLPPRTHRA